MVVAIDAKRDDGTGRRLRGLRRSGTATAATPSSGPARPPIAGAGEILLTSIDRDGTRSGFDCELTAAVSSAVSIPVIASGGAGVRHPLVDFHLRLRRWLAAPLPLLRHGVADQKQHPLGRTSTRIAAGG